MGDLYKWTVVGEAYGVARSSLVKMIDADDGHMGYRGLVKSA